MDKWLESNLFAKIFAVMLAVLLWLVVSTEEPTAPPSLTEHEFKVPVTYNLDETQYALIDATESVDIILRGNPADIRTVMPGSLRVIADIDGLGHGVHEQIPVIIEGVPRGVTASSRPATVMLELARKTTVELPVRITLQGTAAPGFTAGQPIVSPSRVFVTATEEELDYIELITAQVNIDNARSVIDETVRVRAVDNEGNELDVEINPTVVDVIVPVSSPFKELPLSLQYEGFPAEGFAVNEVRLSTDQVTIFGPISEIERYEFFPGPVVSIADLRETTTIEQQLQPIHGTTKVEPEEVLITVEIVPSETTRIEDIPITINGVADNISVTLDFQTTDISLEAAPNRIENVQRDDIQIFIDVSNKSLGEHQVPVQVNTPRFVRPFAIERPTITVVIERTEENNEQSP
ncbi:CdaR family protein [Desulfuribacillus alkaliarsenatis]|uniref:YbbR-like domain-containing protein YbbR n=1 Tax=Desulfuribacillus alkaliarsenatis TaxID=766136 RepID=A0A1E5G3R8_9FIRM|nr:CdaR family protein [Desulfuribacillus alkaliarsenatis]OEF97666.1 hypothetical protein BHF68_14280 [Desulfuribacillus alkaliarsenatis]